VSEGEAVGVELADEATCDELESHPEKRQHARKDAKHSNGQKRVIESLMSLLGGS
jgi:hypothetical protein